MEKYNVNKLLKIHNKLNHPIRGASSKAVMTSYHRETIMSILVELEEVLLSESNIVIRTEDLSK